MDMATAFDSLNWLAVICAAAVVFLAGGLWYGPLFSKAWIADFGFSQEDLAGRNQLKVFGLAFVLNIIMATNLAMFMGPQADLAFGLAAGFFTGFGFVAALLGVYYLFEGRPLRLFFINGGFAVINFTLMGAVIAAFN